MGEFIVLLLHLLGAFLIGCFGLFLAFCLLQLITFIF